MNKIINLAKQTVAYFLIVLFLSWILIKIGIKIDLSITFVIGLTVGWAIFKVGENIIRKLKNK